MRTYRMRRNKKIPFLNQKELTVLSILLVCSILALSFGYILTMAIIYAAFGILFSALYFKVNPDDYGPVSVSIANAERNVRRCGRLAIFFIVVSSSMFAIMYFAK